MKKVITIIAASLVLFSSCTAYTCATYTSVPKVKEAKELKTERM